MNKKKKKKTEEEDDGQKIKNELAEVPWKYRLTFKLTS